LEAEQLESREFETRPVVTASVGHFVHDIFTSFLAPLLPLLIAKHDLSVILAGALVVFLRLPSALSPWLGAISDRVNLRQLAILAPTVTAVTMSLLGAAPVYSLACVLLMAAGCSSAVFHVYGPVMIARASGDRLGRGMSFWMTAGELARTAGPLVAVWVVSLWSLETIYPVAAAGAAASIFLWITLDKPSNPSPRRPTASKVRLREVWGRLRTLMLPLAGIMVARAFLAATLMAFLPTYMVDRGASLWLGGASLAAFELSGAGGTFLGGSASDRVGRKTILFVSLPVSAALVAALVLLPSWGAIPVVLLLGVIVFSISPVVMAVVQENCGDLRGSANGLYMGINFVTAGAVTLLVGGMADLIGFRWAFLASAVIGLGGIPFVFRLPARKA
jgi:FSR family fosmidomycin resistance protein-like MFS transporter